jgi:predicted acetyltransferase
MTALVRPDLRLHESWAAALHDFGAGHVPGAGLWELGPEVSTSREGCAAVVEVLARCADPDAPRPLDRVASDYFWIVDDSTGEVEVVGFLATRHDLTPGLLEEGGHIGYSVRPSRRREGHASRALQLALDHAVDLGLPRVLITCDTDNAASRRTIEAAGGELEDVRRDTLRFWVDLVARARGRAEAHARGR